MEGGHGRGHWEDAKSHYWKRHSTGHAGMLATKIDRAEGRSFFPAHKGKMLALFGRQV
jgi:hypothetical protein